MGVALLAVDAPPTTSTSGALVYVLGLLLTGALGTSGFQFYKYRKQAQREDDSLIAQATGEAVTAAKEMLAEYRADLQRAKEDLKEISGELKKANEEIIRLQADLRHSTEDRERLGRELTSAIEKRAAMQQQFNDLREQMEELRRVVRGSIEREDAREGGRRHEDA